MKLVAVMRKVKVDQDTSREPVWSRYLLVRSKITQTRSNEGVFGSGGAALHVPPLLTGVALLSALHLHPPAKRRAEGPKRSWGI